MKLKDFYSEIVYNNDNFIAGWSKLYYGVFSKVIEENNYKKIAEVGIGYGTHAKFILKNNTNIEHLYLIDPMKYYLNDGFAEDIISKEPEIPGNNFNELYDLINLELNNWKEKYTWFRTESLSVTNDQIKDGSLDCIFIDGDHSYEAVIKDLSFWWKKLKFGGQLLGDDYWMYEVAQAVQKFANENNLSYDLLNRDDSNYKIYRFTKLTF